jgi:hypothetical protein
MRIGIDDIASYVFCPVLQEKKRYDIIIPKLTFAEHCIREAFIDGERNACLKDSVVTPRKLMRAWEGIWWPAATEKKLSMEEANEVSLRASCQFSDYCKYDMSDWDFPTVGVAVESEIKLGPVTLCVSADVVKADLSGKKPCTVVVNFSSRKLSLRQASIDPAIKAAVYAFYGDRDENVAHILVDINERSDKIKAVVSIFRPEDMKHIRAMLEHVARGIYSRNYYHNPGLCKECKVCQDFTS